MVAEYRFALDSGSRKHRCPACQKSRLVRYIDIEGGRYLPEQYGRCDRESKCAYHLNPYSDGYAKSLLGQDHSGLHHSRRIAKLNRNVQPPAKEAERVYFDFETFKRTLNPDGYDGNQFIQNLLSRVRYPFSVEDVTAVIQLYRLGTVMHGHRAGATTFPFIDSDGRVRAIQVKQFDEANHTTSTDFLHSILDRHHARKGIDLPEWLKGYVGQEKKVSCLFGEHFLSKYPMNPIALVEAPKTAIYGTLYFGLPKTSEELIWLAVYNKSSFSLDKMKVLKGRDVFVFPDLSKDGSTFREWKSKASDFERQLTGTRFKFSDLLETIAPVEMREAGADIADVLIRMDWREFRTKQERSATAEDVCSACKEVDHKTIPEPLPQSTPEPCPKGLPIAEGEKGEKGEHYKNILKISEANRQAEGSVKGEWIFHVPRMTTVSWEQELTELEQFFNGITLPINPIRLNKCGTINNCSLFVESHFDTLKANDGNNTFLPYLKRLHELKNLLMSISQPI